jgi:hypothetical protein
VTIFEYNNQQYITINGKSFFLARGYSRERGEPVFIQATGNYPLYEEDLPNATKWRLIKTKAGDRIVYVAYQHEYHNYGSERTTGKLLFPAPTSQGSYFLAWKYVNDRFGLKMDEEQLSGIPEDEFYGLLTKVRDEGNSGTSVFLLNISDGIEERFRKKYEEIRANGGPGV